MCNFTDFMKPGVAASAALQDALAAAIQGDHVLHFPPGEYHFYPEGCSRKYCWFSNNDEGIKTIAILLDSVDDFTISGKDALLIFHGRISPLAAFNCRNLKVEGLRVDFADSFVSDADLVCRENGIAWFRLPGQHKVVNGKIVFTEDFYDNLHGKLFFFSYDCEKKELIRHPGMIVVENRNILSRDGLVGVPDQFAEVRTDAFLIKHEMRLCPGMVFDHCTNVQLSGVTLHHAAGMGFLLQASDTCTVENCIVAPRGRRTSVSDDALHITDCRGRIRIADCDLSGTLDDSINVHGVFRNLKFYMPDGGMYYLETGHHQQMGVFNIQPGDHLELRHRKTGVPYCILNVTQAHQVNRSYSVLEFAEKKLPPEFTEGDPAWILETQAELRVENTRCFPLNGRGILASGLRNIHISGCTFHTYGAGVFIPGDFNYWYESGPVAHAVIENNFFDNCCNSPGGVTREPLTVFPELRELEKDFYYHGSITVRNNRFRADKRCLISMLSVAEAAVEGNTFEYDSTYPFIHRGKTGYFFTDNNSPMAAFKHCGKVTVGDNPGFEC